MDEKPSVDPRFDPVFQRGYDPGVPSASIVETDQESEPRNPWLVALVVVSVVFVVLGCAIAVWPGGNSYVYSSSNPPTAIDLFVQSMSYLAPPALLSTGLIGLVARVTLEAVWRRP